MKYPSDAYPEAKARRLRRISKRAVPELIAAFEHGELSLRQFDSLSRLRPRQQKRRIAERQQQIDAALVAAQTIEENPRPDKSRHTDLPGGNSRSPPRGPPKKPGKIADVANVCL
jgi:hypothetical protein